MAYQKTMRGAESAAALEYHRFQLAVLPLQFDDAIFDHFNTVAQELIASLR